MGASTAPFGYSWAKRSPCSGELEAAIALHRFSSSIAHLNGHSTCGNGFSSNSRPLFRKPAMFQRVALASVPPDPDGPRATRHLLLLFHKPLSLYSLQSSIMSPMADETTRSSAHSSTVQSLVARGWCPSCGSAPLHSLQLEAEATDIHTSS